MRPKIFIIRTAQWTNGDVASSALAESGDWLTGHYSSSLSYARHDMGLTSRWKHDKYTSHYPDGYELVDLLDKWDDDLEQVPEFIAAVERAKAKTSQESLT